MNSCVRYAFTTNSTYPGEFEFCSSTQEHWVCSYNELNKEVALTIKEHMHSVDPPYTRQEALDELGIRKFKLTVKEYL